MLRDCNSTNNLYKYCALFPLPRFCIDYLFPSAACNINNNGYFQVLFLQRAHSPFILLKRCEHNRTFNRLID